MIAEDKALEMETFMFKIYVFVSGGIQRAPEWRELFKVDDDVY